jgi:hypothetical protein
MNPAPNAVNIHAAPSQPRCENSRLTNAVITPKPTLASARPRAGQEHHAQHAIEGRARATHRAHTPRSGSTSARAASGISAVAQAMPAKPVAAYSRMPAGAPSA